MLIWSGLEALDLFLSEPLSIAFLCVCSDTSMDLSVCEQRMPGETVYLPRLL